VYNHSRSSFTPALKAKEKRGKTGTKEKIDANKTLHYDSSANTSVVTHVPE